MVFSYAILRTPALGPSTVVDEHSITYVHHIDTDAHGMSVRSDLYPWRNHASIRTPQSNKYVFWEEGGPVDHGRLRCTRCERGASFSPIRCVPEKTL